MTFSSSKFWYFDATFSFEVLEACPTREAHKIDWKLQDERRLRGNSLLTKKTIKKDIYFFSFDEKKKLWVKEFQ